MIFFGSAAPRILSSFDDIFFQFLFIFYRGVGKVGIKVYKIYKWVPDKTTQINFTFYVHPAQLSLVLIFSGFFAPILVSTQL